MKLTISGEPTPKARARTVKSGHSYTPQKTKDAEENVKAAWLDEFGSYQMTLSPVRMVIRFYLKAPQTVQKQHDDLECVPAKGRSDIDNFCKLLMDGLQGLAYQNDSQVYSLHAEKFYSTNPRTEVEIFAE